MKMPEVRTQDGSYISHEDIKNEDIQSLLRRSYQGDHSRPVCCCREDGVELELVIALKRKTGLFELRKMPGQSHELHSSKCFFSKPNPVSTRERNQNSFNVLMPTLENGWFADHLAIDNLNRALHKFIREDIEIRNWLHMKLELIDLGKSLVVNDEPLSKILNVINPRTKDNLAEIWFGGNEPRLVFAELLSARKVKEGSSLLVRLKGCSDVLWFNSYQLPEPLIEKVLSNTGDKRVFILATVRKSTTGKSVQAHGLSIRNLNKNFK